MYCRWIQLDQIHQQQQISFNDHSRKPQGKEFKDADLVNEELSKGRALRVH